MTKIQKNPTRPPAIALNTEELNAVSTPSSLPLDRRVALQAVVAGKPSEYAAQVEAFRKADRGRIGFSNLPMPIVEKFQEFAMQNGMGKKEYFLHLCREAGMQIPAYVDLDARIR